jgi:ADP-ribose pyrophosphatase
MAFLYNPGMHELDSLEVLDDQMVGTGGFLAVRRLRLRNRRRDGSVSEPYTCDFIVRPKGIDAVVVAIYMRAGDGVRVLLRDGLRPPLKFGREGVAKPVPDRRPYLLFRELVAGIVEPEDRGEAGLRRRAAIEASEEAGFDVDAADVVLLGASSFPSPGAHPERYWLTAVEIADPDAQRPLEGDGSPMEEGAATVWLGLDAAIAACVAGEIEDCKTELALRRLRAWLDDDPSRATTSAR